MAGKVIINLDSDTISESTLIGTEVGAISIEGTGVSIISATVSGSVHVEYSGMEHWEQDYDLDAFAILGAKIVLKKNLDYEKYNEIGSSYYKSVSFISVTALASDGAFYTTSKIFRIGDVIEEIRGTEKSDVLTGSAGADYINARAGNDAISGWEANDIIYGGLGADRMSGGEGADTFVFKSVKESTTKSPDLIMDWDHRPDGTRDVIDLSAIDARADYSGNQAFKWLGTKAFDGKKGELRYETKKDFTAVYADLNGDKKADFLIKIMQPLKLYADDFLL